MYMLEGWIQWMVSQSFAQSCCLIVSCLDKAHFNLLQNLKVDPKGPVSPTSSSLPGDLKDDDKSEMPQVIIK